MIRKFSDINDILINDDRVERVESVDNSANYFDEDFEEESNILEFSRSSPDRSTAQISGRVTSKLDTNLQYYVSPVTRISEDNEDEYENDKFELEPLQQSEENNNMTEIKASIGVDSKSHETLSFVNLEENLKPKEKHVPETPIYSIERSKVISNHPASREHKDIYLSNVDNVEDITRKYLGTAMKSDRPNIPTVTTQTTSRYYFPRVSKVSVVHSKDIPGFNTEHTNQMNQSTRTVPKDENSSKMPTETEIANYLRKFLQEASVKALLDDMTQKLASRRAVLVPNLGLIGTHSYANNNNNDMNNDMERSSSSSNDLPEYDPDFKYAREVRQSIQNRINHPFQSSVPDALAESNTNSHSTALKSNLYRTVVSNDNNNININNYENSGVRNPGVTQISSNKSNIIYNNNDNNNQNHDHNRRGRKSNGINSVKNNRIGTDISELREKCQVIYANFMSDIIGTCFKIYLYQFFLLKKSLLITCMYMKHIYIFINIIESCKQRAANSTSIEELAMHRVLSEHLFKIFNNNNANSVEILHNKMLSAALDVSLKTI